MRKKKHKPLKSSFSKDLCQWIQAKYGVDIEAEMLHVIKEMLSKQLDNEITRLLKKKGVTLEQVQSSLNTRKRGHK